MQLTVRALGHVREDPVFEGTKEKLLGVFRAFHAKSPQATLFPLGIGDAYVSPGEHIAYFWESEEDFERGVGFLEAGLRGQDCCFVFGYEEANQKVKSVLFRKGFDLRALAQSRRLIFVGGNASGEALLSSLGAAFSEAIAAGATAIRLLGNPGWGRQGWPSDNAILEFEAKVTLAAKQFPCVILCAYEVHAVSGRILLKGRFETHPLTVHGQELHSNPHYVPVDKYLAQLEGEPSRKSIQ